MKPMLKAAFLSLVNDLLARGIKPVLNASTLTSYGSIKWTDGDSTRVEQLYSVRDCSPLTASIFRKRFIAWFEEIVNKHQVQLVADAGIVVGGLVWDKLFYTKRTVTAIRADGVLELDAEVARRLDEVIALLPDDPNAGKSAFQAYWEMAGGLYEYARADFDEMHAEALEMAREMQIEADRKAGRPVDEEGNDTREWCGNDIAAAHAEALAFNAEVDEVAAADQWDEWANQHDSRKTEAQMIESDHAEALQIEAARRLTAHQARFIFTNTAAERAEATEAAHAEALAMNATLGLFKEPNQINER